MAPTVKIFALLGLVALAGCETISGAGQDMQSAGRAVERESAQAQY